MPNTGSDDEETPFGMAKKHQRSMRVSLAMGWIFIILGAVIVYLPLTNHFSAKIFWSLLVLVVVCVFISIHHFCEAAHSLAQKQYEPKLLAKERKYRELENKHNQAEIFYHKSMFTLVMVCLAKISASNQQKRGASVEPVKDKEDN